MKYDILETFREELNKELTPNTAKKYYSSVNKLFKGLNFNRLEEIPEDYISTEIVKRFKSKNEVSAVKCGLSHLKACYPTLQIPDSEYFTEICSKKRNRTVKPPKELSLKDTRKAIAAIQNEKLQLAYKLILDSGLRISEAAALKKEDFRFEEGEKITILVQKGKGGMYGQVKCIRNPELYKQLQQFVSNSTDDKVFYTEVYMREVAYNAGFEPHDLRRIFSQRSRQIHKKTMTAYEANACVQEDLRHKRFSTTKRYLFNRKLKFDDAEEEGVDYPD